MWLKNRFASFFLIFCLFLLNFLPFFGNNVKSALAQEETSTTEFLYTAGGQRIAKIEGDGVHTYYLPGVEVIIDENGSVSYRRYYAFNGSVAVRDNNGISFTHSDQLGSTAITTDANGDLIGSASYYPFGATRTSEGTIVGERKYTGQVSDEDTTGLYYYNARYYSPTIGRFTQADTASDGQNKYAYVGNNPVNANDPTGHKAGDPIMHDYDGGWTPPARYPNGRRDRGNYGNTPENLLFPWDAPQYSYDASGQDPMISFLYENPEYNIEEFLLHSPANYSDIDVETILSDFYYYQPLVQFEMGLIDDPFGEGGVSMIAAEAGTGLISMAATPQFGSAFRGAWASLQGLFNRNSSNGYITLYRGSNYSSDPTQIATPRGLDVSDEAVLHHAFFGYTENTGYTSWTPDLNIARSYAGNGGTIISIRVPINDPLLVDLTNYIIPVDLGITIQYAPIINTPWQNTSSWYTNLATGNDRRIMNTFVSNAARIMLYSHEMLYRGIPPNITVVSP